MATDFTAAITDDTPVVGNWVTFPEPAVAELFAALGFDFVTVDMEHSAMTLETTLDAIRAVDAAADDAAAIVRLPGHDPDRIKRVLDAGVDGIMAPMVETPAEAEALVEACRYPPAGRRGVGPGRGSDYGVTLPETIAAGEDAFTLILQIESPEGVDNAREIAATPGVDALFVGPTDLTVAMGGLDESDAEFLDAVESVLDSAAATDTPVGTFAVGDDSIERWGERAFDFLAVGFDAHHLVQDAERARATYDSLTEQ